MNARLLVLVLSGLLSIAGAAPLIDADFPGGNIIVDKIDGDHVHLHQDLRDTKGDWFFWYFRVREAAGRTLTFHFTKGNPIGARGPAVSDDGGANWQWLGTQAVHGASFSHAFPPGAGDIRFCFAFPYLEANLRDFLRRHETNAAIRVTTLCSTPKGREVPLLLIGSPAGVPPRRVVLTCRHHCCETMASFALEGIIETILGGTDDGRWLREHVAFFIVPLVDLDGVQDGDQGKNRKPYDHNRDYDDPGIYASTRAIRQRVPAWAAGRLDFALDLHCPYIRGGMNETVYFVGGRDQKIWAEAGHFSRLLETHRTGPLPYFARNNLPFGKDWNTEANYGGRTSFARWGASQPGIAMVATLEIAYANASGVPVTADSARALGHDLAAALRRYLESLPPTAANP